MGLADTHSRIDIVVFPVSYTHLDVYKRQLSGVLGEGGADFDDTICGFAFGEGHRVVVDPGSGKHDPLPVSYTHLGLRVVI